VIYGPKAQLGCNIVGLSTKLVPWVLFDNRIRLMFDASKPRAAMNASPTGSQVISDCPCDGG
jgi:hypothetical protein